MKAETRLLNSWKTDRHVIMGHLFHSAPFTSWSFQFPFSVFSSSFCLSQFVPPAKMPRSKVRLRVSLPPCVLQVSSIQSSLIPSAWEGQKQSTDYEALFMQYLPTLLLLSALSILCSDTPIHCHPTADANFHLRRIYCSNFVYFHVWVFT